MTGRKLGNYEVLDKLGEGGMGEVWRARDERLNRTVAVKILPADMAGDPSRRLRFEQEARALGALNHPNIVAVYDVGQSDGQSYIVSELVDGESLRKVIDRGPIPSRRLLDMAVQTAEALAAAHALGIVHRDLKPENIMITGPSSGSAGRVKVLDFGLAKQNPTKRGGDDTATLMLSQAGMVLGTVGYMSPEQVRAEPVDGRSDIFAFGCVLYEMATGKHAFEGKTAADVISAVLKEEPPEISTVNPTVPSAVDAIVRRCLEKDPAQRFQSAADMAFALRAISSVPSSQSGTQIVAMPPAHHRPKWLVPAVAAVSLVVVFIAGYALRARTSKALVQRFQRITFREGSISTARFSPDWQDVVYSADWDAGPTHIYQAHPGSPESRDLGLPESRLLSVSSKGDLAFLTGPFTPNGFGTLARNSISGGQTRELLEHVRLADWSPDATQMAVVREVEGKTRLEYPVGKVLGEFPSLFSIRISPDGQRVAYTTFEKENRIGLFVVDRDGKTQDLGPITGQVSELDAAPLCWTPDGREIWFSSYDSHDLNTIHAMSLSGKQRVVATFPGRVTLFEIAADGRLLLSTDSGRKGIRGMAPGDETDRDLSCLDASSLRGISDDGSLIVADVLGESGGPKGSVYMRRTIGTEPVRLGDGAAFTLSPDGKWIAGFSSRDSASRMFELMPTGPGEAVPTKPIVGWLAGPKNYLVIEKSPKAGIRFEAWDAAANKSRPVSPDGMPDLDDLPLVSPDGRQFIATGADGDRHIYSIDGGDPKPVTGLTGHDRPVGWNIDGHSVYITTHRNQNRTIPVSVVDLATGKRTPWKEIKPTVPVDTVGDLRITPDGKAYAYNFTYLRSELFVAEGIR